MASTHDTTQDTQSTRGLKASFEHFKSFLADSSDQLNKLELMAINRRITNEIVDDVKATYELVSEELTARRFNGAARTLGLGLIDSARDIVTVATSEAHRVSLIDTVSHITIAGLDFVRNELEQVFDAGEAATHRVESNLEGINKTVTDRLSHLAPRMGFGEKRPGTITRVNIETADEAAQAAPASQI